MLIEKDESPGMLKFEHERLSVKEAQGKVEAHEAPAFLAKVRCSAKGNM